MTHFRHSFRMSCDIETTWTNINMETKKKEVKKIAFKKYLARELNLVIHNTPKKCMLGQSEKKKIVPQCMRIFFRQQIISLMKRQIVTLYMYIKGKTISLSKLITFSNDTRGRVRLAMTCSQALYIYVIKVEIPSKQNIITRYTTILSRFLNIF